LGHQIHQSLLENENFEVPGDDTDYESRFAVKNYLFDEYQRALKGQEYWIDEDSGALRTLTPMGPADHVIAGMVGINYFYFNVLYRPAVATYIPVTKSNDKDCKVTQFKSDFIEAVIGSLIDALD